ncbi:restriction endonuclease subunit S [Avibacterium avium]
MSNIPKLRFPEFTDAWEKWELGKIVNIVGGGTPDTNNATYWNGNIDWYSPTEIGNEIYVSNSLKKISKLGLEKSSAKLLPAHKTILFTSRASIGDMAILLKSSTTNQGFQSFVVDEEKVDIYFLYSLGFKIKHFALKNATGSTFLEISKKQLEKMEISIPTLPEQQKIGNLFKQLDRLITLHKRKWDDVILLKKALLQKMFPKNGSDFPEIRFPEFTDAWEKCKLGKIVKERNEQYPKSNEYPLMAFISGQGIADKGERYNRDFLVSDEESKKYKRTELDDFIYSSNNLETGSIGLNRYGKACISPVYSIFYIDKSNDPYFIGQRLIQKDFIYQMTRYRQGVVYGQWRIHEKDFLKLSIIRPALPEQQKIGNLFKQLDRLITLHKRQHEHYQLLKKALLQQMFV